MRRRRVRTEPPPGRAKAAATAASAGKKVRKPAPPPAAARRSSRASTSARFPALEALAAGACPAEAARAVSAGRAPPPVFRAVPLPGAAPRGRPSPAPAPPAMGPAAAAARRASEASALASEAPPPGSSERRPDELFVGRAVPPRASRAAPRTPEGVGGRSAALCRTPGSGRRASLGAYLAGSTPPQHFLAFWGRQTGWVPASPDDLLAFGPGRCLLASPPVLLAASGVQRHGR